MFSLSLRNNPATDCGFRKRLYYRSVHSKKSLDQKVVKNVFVEMQKDLKRLEKHYMNYALEKKKVIKIEKNLQFNPLTIEKNHKE